MTDPRSFVGKAVKAGAKLAGMQLAEDLELLPGADDVLSVCPVRWVALAGNTAAMAIDETGCMWPVTH